ncbi:hypothetical protein NG799_22520 [Laspinema sp. D1]|uniref:Uncharacterized protein n=1 Tax=Laspinema palackyanum D2a TaxID=2953684 RepID=A0ABT2MX54_9CYAN|nr:hypothetical protein [Laspinema sp. D2a]
MPYRLQSETFSDECLHPHIGRSALQALRYNSWKPYWLFKIHDNQQVLRRTHERLKSLLQTEAAAFLLVCSNDFSRCSRVMAGAITRANPGWALLGCCQVTR